VSVFFIVRDLLLSKIDNTDLIKQYTEWRTAEKLRALVSKSFQMFRGPNKLRKCKI